MSKDSKLLLHDSLGSYLNARDRFYMNTGIKLGDIAIGIAHNAATNRKTTTSAFVNQIHSITEMLKAGFGLELDLHWNEKNQEIDVCHSPSIGCLNPILDRTPFKDVAAEIRSFIEENPDRFVFLDFEDRKILGNVPAREEVEKILLDKKFKNADDFKGFLEKIFNNKDKSKDCLSEFKFGHFPEFYNIISEAEKTHQDEDSLKEEIRGQIEKYYSGIQEFIIAFEKDADDKHKFDTASSLGLKRNYRIDMGCRKDRHN